MSTLQLSKRIETRYKFETPDFLDYLKANFEQQKFSDNEYSQTIFLDTNPPKLDEALRLKARRYLPTTDKSITEEDKFIVEVKIDKKEHNQKERLDSELKLKEIISHFNGIYGDVGQIVPYAATFYKRANFFDKSFGEVKITIDFNVELYKLNYPSLDLILIEKEIFNRVEFKYEESNQLFADKVTELVTNFNLEKAESKHNKIYRLLNESADK